VYCKLSRKEYVKNAKRMKKHVVNFSKTPRYIKVTIGDLL
jgi:hypothetical protein